MAESYALSATKYCLYLLWFLYLSESVIINKLSIFDCTNWVSCECPLLTIELIGTPKESVISDTLITFLFLKNLFRLMFPVPHWFLINVESINWAFSLAVLLLKKYWSSNILYASLKIFNDVKYLKCENKESHCIELLEDLHGIPVLRTYKILSIISLIVYLELGNFVVYLIPAIGWVQIKLHKKSVIP